MIGAASLMLWKCSESCVNEEFSFLLIFQMNITSNDEYDVDKRRLRTTLNREIIATFIKIIEFHGVVS